MSKRTRATSKVLSLLLAVIMLVGVMATGFVASAAVQADPPQWNSKMNYTAGSQVSYQGNIYQANMYASAGVVPFAGTLSWDTWKLIGPCKYPAPFANDDGKVKLTSVKMVAKVSTGGRDHIGFGLYDNASEDQILRTPNSLGNAGTQVLKPNTQYIVYLTVAPPWYVGTKSGDCAAITVNANGSVRIDPCGFGNSGATASDTLNYRISATKGGFTIEWVADQQIQEILAKDMYIDPSTTIYGNGVDDATLEQWATLTVNRAISSDTALSEGSNRQGFSVNYLPEMIAGLGVPARTESLEPFKSELLEYYPKAKAANDQYMKHLNYQYSDYYLHDIYCQGVWDTMPAAYGWEQDEYTEPGLIIKTLYPQISGKSYGLAGGGQNPWVLCDYLERNAGYVDAKGNEVKGTKAGAGWYKGYDEVSKVPYLWQPEHGVFLSYENVESLTERCDYVNENNLAGIIVWELSGDNTDTYPMLSTMKKELGSDKKILGYFTNWSVYNQYHQYQKPSDLPLDILTHVNYSFFQVGGYYERGLEAPANCLNSMDRWADDYTVVDAQEKAPNMIPEFATLKQTNDFNLLISVGGWTRGDGFNAMVNSEANRATFINSVKEFLTQYPQFDGIDLDWEYPSNDRLPDFDDPNDLGSPASPEHNFDTYTYLCRDLRTMLDANFPSRNLLTACAPAAPANAAKQNLVDIAKYCSFINCMTYDYHGAFDPTIGYNSPLYAHPETPDEWSTENTVDYYLQAGVPASKLNIGTPFYSRGWAGVKADANGNPQPLQDPTPIFPTGEAVNPTSITVNPTSLTMEVGDTSTITATVLPSDAADKTVTWSSSNPSVATVDKNGKVTAVAKGTATITAKTSNNLTATCTVTVNEKATTDLGFAAFEIGTLDVYHSYYGVMQASAQTIIRDGRAYVAMREGAAVCEASCDYTEVGGVGKIMLTYPEYKAEFTVGGTDVSLYFLSGELYQTVQIPADQVPVIVDGRTYLPARVLGQISCVTGRTYIYYISNDQTGGIGEYVIYTTGQATEAQLKVMAQKANSAING